MNGPLEVTGTTTARETAQLRRHPRSRVTSKGARTTTAVKQEQFQSIGAVIHDSSCMTNTTGNDDCFLCVY